MHILHFCCLGCISFLCTDDIQEITKFQDLHSNESSEVGFLRCCLCTCELGAPHTKEKQRTALYMYLILGGYGIHLEVQLKTLFFPLWQASNTHSILEQHSFSVTKNGYDLYIQKGVPSRGKRAKGSSILAGSDFWTLQPAGYRTAPPLPEVHSWLACRPTSPAASHLRSI